MDKTLSQEEVNALLSGYLDGDIEEGAEEGAEDGAEFYDLTNHERIVRGRMPTLEIINERFARFFSVSLASSLRRDVEFSTVSIDIMKFGDFMRKIPLPSSINIFTMNPLRGYALVVFNASLVYLLVDHYFGGTCQTHVKPEGRSFSNIESSVVGKMVDYLFKDLTKAWHPVHEVDIEFHRTEINPQFAAIVAPTEVVISITFRLDIENEGAEVFLCIPYATVESIKEKLYAGFQSDRLEVDNSWIERLKDEVHNLFVDLVADCGNTTITIEELLDLKEGDIILLDKRHDEPMEVRVNGVQKYGGIVGVSKGTQSIQITDVYPLILEEV